MQIGKSRLDFNSKSAEKKKGYYLAVKDKYYNTWKRYNNNEAETVQKQEIIFDVIGLSKGAENRKKKFVN